MYIQKADKTYTIKENEQSWTVNLSNGNFDLTVGVQKDICKTFNELKEYINKENLF